jgi:hypothetical protein
LTASNRVLHKQPVTCLTIPRPRWPRSASLRRCPN